MGWMMEGAVVGDDVKQLYSCAHVGEAGLAGGNRGDGASTVGSDEGTKTTIGA